jgi:HD superfamily phosphohydrolase
VKFFVYRDDIAALPAHRGSGPISASTFIDELHNLCSFHHENVIKILDGGFWRPSPTGPRIPYLVTEYVEGLTLQALLKPENRSRLRELLSHAPELPVELAIQVCRGIAHLHSRSFYHCDIAPKNIFIELQPSSRVRAIIGDLGLGKTLPMTSSRARVHVAGTRDYCTRPVRDVLDHIVSASVFAALQPHWDLFGTARTLQDLLKGFQGFAVYQTPWLTALRHLLDEAIQGDTVDAKRIASISQLLLKIEWLHPQHHTLAQLPELTERYPGNHQLPLPVDAITTSKRIRRLVQHPALLRLKHVPQLLMSSAVFPGATHSRYEHSLGTYQAARRYLLALMDDERFLAAFDSSMGELTLVAALLSNVTRHPFSSVIHEIQSRDPEAHRGLGVDVIYDEILDRFSDSREPLNETIATWFPSVDRQILRGILINDPASFQASATHFVHFLLNSSLDARVLDYLRRDAVCLGLSRGDPIEFEELLRHIRFLNGELVVRVQGLSVVEQVITLRYWLFNRIYWNSPNRALMAMLKWIFYDLSRADASLDAELLPLLLHHTERGLIGALAERANAHRRTATARLCELLAGDEPQRFAEIGQYNRAEDDASAHVLCDKLAAMSGAQYMGVTSRINAHLVARFGLRDDRVHVLIDLPMEVRGRKLGEDINIVTHRGASIPLASMSSIIAGAQQGFLQHLQRMRCFASRETLNHLGDGQRLWNEVQDVLRTVP